MVTWLTPLPSLSTVHVVYGCPTNEILKSRKFLCKPFFVLCIPTDVGYDFGKLRWRKHLEVLWYLSLSLRSIDSIMINSIINYNSTIAWHLLISSGVYNLHTDTQISLHTLLVKYFKYNDLLGSQSSGDRDEVTYFFVGNVFCVHLGFK